MKTIEISIFKGKDTIEGFLMVDEQNIHQITSYFPLPPNRNEVMHMMEMLYSKCREVLPNLNEEETNEEQSKDESV